MLRSVRNHIHPFCVFILSILTPLAFLLALKRPFFVPAPDGLLYWNIAENFIEGRGFVNSIRGSDLIVPPGFSIILLPFALIFRNPVAYVVFQFGLFGMNGVMCFQIGNRIFQNRTVGWFTALTFALHPVILTNGPQFLLTETLFVTIILGFAYFSFGLFYGEQPNRAFWKLNALLGVSLLYRPHLMYGFILTLVAFFALRRRNGLRYSALVSLLIPVLLLLANGLSNKYWHGEFVLLENYSGQNLYIANNNHTSVGIYTSDNLDAFVDQNYYEFDNLPMSERNEALGALARSEILARPGRMMSLTLQRFLLFFRGFHPIEWIHYILVVLGFVLSLGRLKNQRLFHIYLGLFILGFAGLTSLGLIVSGNRYRMPIIPVYSLYGAYAVCWILQKVLAGPKNTSLSQLNL